MPATYPPDDAPLGDPDALDELARRCRRTARGLLADGVVLGSTAERAHWSGPAAAAFRRSLQHLPRDLTRAAESYETVALALAGYAEDVRAAGRRARHARDELATLGADIVAERHLLVGGVTGSELAVRERRIVALELERAEVQRRLETLTSELAGAACRAARLVRSASEPPGEPPNLFERLVDGVGDWVEDHAEQLAELSGVLKGIAAVAGIASMLPGVGQAAVVIAAAAGAAATLVDAALASRQRAAWRDVAVGAALTALGGTGLARVTAREAHARVVSERVYRVEGATNQRVLIDAEGNVRFQKRQMLYLNVGQRSRAEEYCRQKLREGLPEAHLVTFRVRRSQLRELRGRAVDQTLSKQFPRAPHRVDVTRAPDQFGLWKHDFRELQRHVLAGSGKVLRCR